MRYYVQTLLSGVNHHHYWSDSLHDMEALFYFFCAKKKGRVVLVDTETPTPSKNWSASIVMQHPKKP